MARTSLVLGPIFMVIFFLVSAILSFICLFSLAHVLLGEKSFSDFGSFVNSNLFNIINQISFIPAIIGGVFLLLGFNVVIGRIGIVLTLLGDITGILSYVKSSSNFLIFYTYSSLFLTSIGLILLGLAFYSKEFKGGGLLLVIGSAVSIPFGVFGLLSLYTNFNILYFLFLNYGNSFFLIFLVLAIYTFFEDIIPSLLNALGFGLILLREKQEWIYRRKKSWKIFSPPKTQKRFLDFSALKLMSKMVTACLT